MNRTLISVRKPTFALPRRNTFQALAAAAALLCSAPALAAAITFESIAQGAYAAGDTIVESGYNILMLDGPLGGGNGAVMDDASCAILACPGNPSGQFLGVLNDGGVNFSLSSGVGPGFKLGGLDFAFLAAVGGQPDGSYGQLRLSGLLADGTTLTTALDLPGQDANGLFTFAAASFGSAFSSAIFKSLTIDACAYVVDFNCDNSLENPAFYLAQFALDNVQLNVVPEPVSVMLIGLGMGAMALGRRRTVHPSKQAAQGA